MMKATYCLAIHAEFNVTPEEAEGRAKAILHLLKRAEVKVIQAHMIGKGSDDAFTVLVK